MVDQRVVDYIFSQIRSGMPSESIIQSLLDSGWSKEQIKEIFDFIQNPEKKEETAFHDQPSFIMDSQPQEQFRERQEPVQPEPAIQPVQSPPEQPKKTGKIGFALSMIAALAVLCRILIVVILYIFPVSGVLDFIVPCIYSVKVEQDMMSVIIFLFLTSVMLYAAAGTRSQKRHGLMGKLVIVFSVAIFLIEAVTSINPIGISLMVIGVAGGLLAWKGK
jgi:hypothetical protein